MKPLLIQYSTVASRSREPFKWQAAGMGYLIRSAAGRWIAVDGGFVADAEPLIALMEEYSTGKPVVDAWLITHPHGDHYQAANFAAQDEKLRARIQVNRFIFCMPPEDFVDAGRGVPYRRDILAVKAAAIGFGAPTYHATAGDVYTVDDLKIEILHTVEDLAKASDPNETSMIFRVLAAGQSILFLGDIYSGPSRQLAARMGAALKSDFCQLAHHALNGGAEELYAFVKPAVALVPMARPAYETVILSPEWQENRGTRHNRNLLKTMRPENIWLSADGDRVVELPYTFSSNA